MLFCCKVDYQIAAPVMMGKPVATQGSATIGFVDVMIDQSHNSKLYWGKSTWLMVKVGEKMCLKHQITSD